jgi:sec-independent protein translocase protein TatA
MEVPSLPHLLMVLVIFMLVFGAKRIPEIAGSMGKGIKEFKKGVNEALHDDAPPVHNVDAGPRSPDRETTYDRTRAEQREEPRRLIP